VGQRWRVQKREVWLGNAGLWETKKDEEMALGGQDVGTYFAGDRCEYKVMCVVYAGTMQRRVNLLKRQAGIHATKADNRF
jgi:hypothetical protein